VIFEQVDVVTLIETEVGGVALTHVIRGAERKTFRQIHEEIRSVQARPKSSAQSGGMVELAQKVPGFVRRGYYWGLRMNPHRFKQIAGTTIVTSVGMFGKGSGWGFGFLPMHNLGLTVGGMALKPGVVEERIEIREYLDLTVSFDHDLIDGAPAARFAQRLKLLVESGEVLKD
jgi:pyruvate/2-oxoglutarate dehydrogenase complex dihydrolipoamide acyltransferase (E2) component